MPAPINPPRKNEDTTEPTPLDPSRSISILLILPATARQSASCRLARCVCPGTVHGLEHMGTGPCRVNASRILRVLCPVPRRLFLQDLPVSLARVSHLFLPCPVLRVSHASLRATLCLYPSIDCGPILPSFSSAPHRVPSGIPGGRCDSRVAAAKAAEGAFREEDIPMDHYTIEP